MFGMRSVSYSARRGVSRPGTGLLLALWVLFSLVSGATRALCLDFGGDCSPSSTAAAPSAAPCHEQSREREFDPGCGSCVDVLVPDDASARCNRPDRDSGGSAASHPLIAANGSFTRPAVTTAAGGSLPCRNGTPHPPLLTAVLLI